MRARLVVLGAAVMMAAACRPADILSVPPPAGVLGRSALASQTGAESELAGAKAQLFSGLDGDAYTGVLMWTGLLTDEFTVDGFSCCAALANVDARVTAGGGGFDEIADLGWQHILQARSSLRLAIPRLSEYEPTGERRKVGEAYALLGYAELIVAEAFCAGTPLTEFPSAGGVQYGAPLTTDSLLHLAAAHFDSATANAAGDDSVTELAAVGLGRALLDGGQYAAAATAVAPVPASFVYDAELEPSVSLGATQGPNLYATGVANASDRMFTIANQEGQNGLDFASAGDPRLAIDSSLANPDGGVWYVPAKFEVNLALVPLATGIEAQLIAAEAALKANQAAVWLSTLNTLRNSGCSVSGTDTTCGIGAGQVPGQTVGLASLSDPGTDSGRVSMMFRERAFWLFGTGERLGDLRRLIRQYGRDQSTVFPVGPYAPAHQAQLPTPLAAYGADVNLTLPTPYGLNSNAQQNPTNPSYEANPNYKGCITSTKIA